MSGSIASKRPKSIRINDAPSVDRLMVCPLAHS